MKPSAESYNLALGDKEAALIRALAQERKALFESADATRVLGADARLVLHRLARKRWVLPLRRGLYALVPLDVGLRGADAFAMHGFVIASLLTEPYYIGFWSALNHHGLTEQIPRTTFVATTRARHAVTVLADEYRFVMLSPRRFFGWQEVEVEGHAVRISSREKTLADCLDHPEHCGGIETVARALYFSHGEVDMARLVSDASRMGNRTILKRLGYLLEQCGLLGRYDDLFARFELSAGYPKLDPLAPRRGRHNRRWGLLINSDLDPTGWQY